MKILVLTKRYTSAKDISREDVGRPYCLFAALGAVGHEVTFLLADYKSRERLDVEKGKIKIMVRPLSFFRIPQFRRSIRKMLLDEGFDILIAEGDPLFALIAGGVCKRVGVPMVYDLMDNYETYDIYCMPFFGVIDRRLIRRADAVVCVTEALRGKASTCRRDGIYVVGNGVDVEFFKPMDRGGCREKLGLGMELPVIGYFGHVVGYKGVDLLLEAHDLLLKGGLTTMLLIAGKREAGVRLPSRHCRYIGLLPQEEIPSCINACDLVAVPGPENDFTKYSFPLKILEAMACDITVVASDIGPAREILGDGYRWLARPGDPRDLSRKIEEALRAGKPELREVALQHSWERKAEQLSSILKEILR